MSSPQQPHPRLFIQMSGAPGSGKSTIARLLRPCINGVVIDHDVLRSSLLESGIIPFDQAAKQAYLLQWALAEDMMKQGFSVIIDSTCNYAEVLARGSALAAQGGYEYWYVECKVQDLDLLDRRLGSRDSKASQRTSVDRHPVAAQHTRAGEDPRALFVKWIENPCRPSYDNAIVVDATEHPETLRDQILDRILPGRQKAGSMPS
ncbi:P-loop containing nucleoside triphosphate hydrolase protein [Nemania sp. FL0916]|nr:P-loop containing nucleoside triphosphate hydrolase protein [Nemania sp. FL0916]